MGDESLEAYRSRLDGASVATLVLIIFAIPSKIWCRAMTSGRVSLGWDDALSVVALLWAIVLFWITMIGFRPYLGRHAFVDVPVNELPTFFKVIFAASPIYVCAIAFSKFTLLAFYWRIFAVAMRIPLIVTSLSVVAWLVALANWDLSVENAKCVEPKAIYLGGSIPNVILDLVLMGLPLPHILPLRLPIRQHLIVVGMFTLGIFTSIVSIIRLVLVMSFESGTDATYNMKDFMLWSVVEVNIGLLCACLPSMRPILRLIGLGRLFSTNSGSDTVRITNGAGTYPVSRSGQDRLFWVRKKGPLFKFGSDEEIFRMVDRPLDRQGENVTAIEAGWIDSSSKHPCKSLSQSGDDGIVVQRDWSVWVNGKGRPEK